MKQSSPRVRLACSKDSIVDYDQETKQLILRMGSSELRFCPICFKKLSAVLAKASDEFDQFRKGEMPREAAGDPEADDRRIAKLLRSQRLDWIQTGLPPKGPKGWLS